MKEIYIIAEAGSNWRSGSSLRDLCMAKLLIDIAAKAQVDAVKFQLFRAERVYVAQAGMVDYLRDSSPQSSILEIFEDLSLPYSMVPELAGYCKEVGVEFMASSFSVEDIEAVDPYVERHKIASYEISHLRLLQAAARTKKPLILSVGASVEEDIEWALQLLKSEGAGPVTLMQSTLSYPTPPAEVNLRVISRLKERFGVEVGLSDHSRDPLCAPIGALALGATVIEKHFTIDNRLPGPDHFFALTPTELQSMVEHLHRAKEMLGSGQKRVERSEQQMFSFGRRAVQSLRAIKRGEILQEGENIAILRPGNQPTGIHPKFLPQIAGKRATRDIEAGEGLKEGDF